MLVSFGQFNTPFKISPPRKKIVKSYERKQKKNILKLLTKRLSFYEFLTISLWPRIWACMHMHTCHAYLSNDMYASDSCGPSDQKLHAENVVFDVIVVAVVGTVAAFLALPIDGYVC